MNELLKVNLQHFADEGDDEQTESSDGDKDEVTLSRSELEKKIEAESDRKLNSALDKQRQKFADEVQAEVDKQLQEHKRLSKLSESEKKEEQLTQREKDLIEREERIKASEVKSDAIDELSKREIDTRFVDFLTTNDADETLDNIKQFNDLLDEAINKAVKSATRQTPPQRGGYNLSDGEPQGKSVLEMAREKRLIK